MSVGPAPSVSKIIRVTRSAQLRSLIGALVTSISTTGQIGVAAPYAESLADLRAFNDERIHNRPESLAQGESVVKALTALVEKTSCRPRFSQTAARW